jgi:regulator of RNase E activity RraA
VVFEILDKFSTWDFRSSIFFNIRPGDYVLADIDGVIVIPQEIIEDVITRTEEVASKETVVRSGLQKGEKIEDLFEKYKVL